MPLPASSALCRVPSRLWPFRICAVPLPRPSVVYSRCVACAVCGICACLALLPPVALCLTLTSLISASSLFKVDQLVKSSATGERPLFYTLLLICPAFFWNSSLHMCITRSVPNPHIPLLLLDLHSQF
ncbi:hypothetical protein C8R44DRAFT_790510 [Mycena epipterygia]|nr:hypothetical protein C8R44DRAFT_790510 [Mycena epipterygia]